MIRIFPISRSFSPRPSSTSASDVMTRNWRPDKGRIMNMKTALDANKNGHGPVKSGDCAELP